MLLNDLIEQLQDLQTDGYGEVEVRILDENSCEEEILRIGFCSDPTKVIYLSYAEEEEEYEEDDDDEEEEVEEEKK